MIRTKQERLKQVYEHLRRYYNVHTQIDFANAIGLTRPALSSAMNGNEAYLTDNLFKRICAAYQGVFELEYLLTGRGGLLTIEEEVKLKTAKPTSLEAKNDYADELIASLRHQLADKERIIKLLEQKIEILEEMQHIDKPNPLNECPFPIGTADDNFKTK